MFILIIYFILKVTIRNFKVFMKQSHDSSDDYKFPVTANEALSEETAVFMSLLSMFVIGSKCLKNQSKQFLKKIVVLCNDKVIIFSAYGC